MKKRNLFSVDSGLKKIVNDGSPIGCVVHPSKLAVHLFRLAEMLSAVSGGLASHK